jgi:hypothetical protein
MTTTKMAQLKRSTVSVGVRKALKNTAGSPMKQNCISVSVVELTVGFTGSTSTDETMKFGLMERGITTGMMGANQQTREMITIWRVVV